MDTIYGVYHRYDEYNGDNNTVDKAAYLLFISTDYDFCNVYAKKYSNPRKYGETPRPVVYLDRYENPPKVHFECLDLFAGEIVVEELPYSFINDINISPDKLSAGYRDYQEYCGNYANWNQEGE